MELKERNVSTLRVIEEPTHILQRIGLNNIRDVMNLLSQINDNVVTVDEVLTAAKKMLAKQKRPRGTSERIGSFLGYSPDEPDHG